MLPEDLRSKHRGDFENRPKVVPNIHRKMLIRLTLQCSVVDRVCEGVQCLSMSRVRVDQFYAFVV